MNIATDNTDQVELRACQCAAGRDLEPIGCPEYDDISQPRVQIFGGITGIAVS